MPTLSEISALIGSAEPTSHADRVVTGVADLDQAGPGDIAFLTSDAYVRRFEATRAGVVVVAKRVKLPAVVHVPVLIVDNADLAVALVLEHFAPPVQRVAAGIDASARLASDATIGPSPSISSNVVVGNRTTIGRNCVIHAGVVIGDDVTVGDDCVLYANVVIRERIRIGHRVIINAGSVIGTDGFGFFWDGKQQRKVPQIGTVMIEDDVEIGSCVCIDRAKFAATRVGRGAKIDNLVQIGHNVQIGPHSIICGQAGLAGSSKLGTGVVLGGQVAIRDHINIGDGAMVAACAGVMEDVEAKSIVSGMPAFPHRQSLREQAALRRLPEIVTTLRKLQEEIEKYKKQLGVDE